MVFAGKLFKATSIYAITSAISSGIPFMLLPILTKYLSPADYGVLSIVGAIISFTFPLTVMGVGTAIYVEYFKLSKYEFRDYVNSAITIPVFLTVINLLLFAVFSKTLEERFGIPSLLANLIPLLACLQVIPYIVCLLYQVREEPLYYGRYQTAQSLLNFSLSFLLIVAFGMGWEGRVAGMYMAYILFTVVGLLILYKNDFLRANIDLRHVKSALVLGGPLVLHELGFVVIHLSDRIFLAEMVGIEAAGIYSLGYQVGMAMNIICVAFNQAWTPFLFKRLSDNKDGTRRELVSKTYGVALAILASIAIFSLVTPFIYKFIIDESFADSEIFAYWTAIGCGFYGLYLLVVNYIYYVKKTHLLTWLTAGSAVLNVLLNFCMINWYGAIGAAYATTISFLTLFILAWWVSNKVCPMPWFSYFNTQFLKNMP